MADVWDELRVTEFPVAWRWAYLDHAAVAPLPRRSGAVLRAWTLEQEENGVVNWPAWAAKIEAIRDCIASLLSADRDEIALVNSTTQGIGLIAEGFPWRDGDSVVIPAEEYPSRTALLPVPSSTTFCIICFICAAVIDEMTRRLSEG